MDRLNELPVWVFHDKSDDIIPCEESVRMVDSTNSAGRNTKLTTYGKGTHDAWTEAYNNDELYERLKHTKTNYARLQI